MTCIRGSNPCLHQDSGGSLHHNRYRTVQYSYSYEYSTVLVYPLMDLWILYGNMVDFSFIVSLYVYELLNVTIVLVQYSYSYS